MKSLVERRFFKFQEELSPVCRGGFGGSGGGFRVPGGGSFAPPKEAQAAQRSPRPLPRTTYRVMSLGPPGLNKFIIIR